MDKVLENYISDKLIDIQNQLDNFDKRLRIIEEKTPKKEFVSIYPSDEEIHNFGTQLDNILRECKDI